MQLARSSPISCTLSELMAQLSQTEMEVLQRSRGRTLIHLKNHIGDIQPVMQSIIEQKGRARVLEIGFGFGIVMAQLKLIYGDSLELHGINRKEKDGNWGLARRSAVMQGLIAEEEFDKLTPPALHYVDVNLGLPFPSDHFDFAYSQVSFFYYEEKAFFLEELNRVLAPGGLARVDVMIERGLPVEYDKSFEIWDGDEQILFWSYIRRFENWQMKKASSRNYLEMHKSEKIDMGLKLVHIIRLNDINKDWWGTKSIYAVK